MSTETKVGLFTFIGIVVFGLLMFLFGNFSVTKGYDIYVYFKDVSGLPAKSAVRLNGVEVGKVKELKIDQGKVLAVVKVNEGVIIYKDSAFAIAANSLIGTNYLQINQGNPASGTLQAGDTVWGKSLPSITGMLEETMGTVNTLVQNINANGQFAKDLGATLQNLRELSGNLNSLMLSLRPYLTQSMSQVSDLTRESKELMKEIKEGEGLFTALMQDEQMKTDVKSTLSNVKEISEEAKKFIGKIAKFRIFWQYDLRYQPNGGLTESDLFIKLYPVNGFSYYQAGITNLGNRDNLPKNEKDYRAKPNQIDARIGLYNDWADLSVGMIRGAGGLVAEVKPLYQSKYFAIKNLGIYGEATDFGRNRYINGRLFEKPYYSLGAKTWITKNIGVGVRYNDIAEASSFQATTSISFEDKELASVLGLATLAK